MSSVLVVLRCLVQAVLLVLFCVVTAYVFCVGKSRTGIRRDYLFLSLLCGVVFFFL